MDAGPNETTARNEPQEQLGDIEALYREGRNREVIARLESLPDSADLSTIRLLTLRAMARFDLGQVVASVADLHEALERSRHAGVSVQFSTAFALFVRETDFQNPDEILPSVTRLRQLAATIGDARSLAALHLAIARVEGCRGHRTNAQHHLELARSFSERCEDEALRCTLDVVEGSLESVAGNLNRSRELATAGLERSTQHGFWKYQIAAAANLAVFAMYSGHLTRARALLEDVLSRCADLTYVSLGASDTMAQLELREGNLDACRRFLHECSQISKRDALPARSWYDLAHQVTRSAYFEHVEKWESIIDVADDADPELARRQYKALRTSLLCAKARALARLGKHRQADGSLAAAVRICPRGAVDPLIALEASKALCASLRGDHASGALFYDRALAACRAIGHRYHEWWIDRDRADILKHTRESVAVAPPARTVSDTSLLVSDIATIIGAGHSIDLLAHRMAAILQSTPLRDRVEIRSESGRHYRPEPSAACETSPDGTYVIRLRGSDRRVSINVRGAETLDEICLLKSMADLAQAAVSRTVDSDTEDEDLNLWPRSLVSSGEDTIFRSPRMAELLRVAERLAATNIPVLITGETGTGKEVIARLIHERSPVKRGPFVPFNCSAMPRELVESQLFGHRRGAFTGAVDSFPGVIRMAERGSLFLDEIGDLDPAAQPKLLRFLESGEIHPVGDVRTHIVGARIIAATNADLADLVEQGRFRRDLYYRIGTARIALPPLRERKDEIPALASLFLARFAKECGRTGLRLGDDLIAALLLYHWPGNIRQLANEIRRVAAMAEDGQTLGAASLDPEITAAWDARPVASSRPPAPAISIRLDQPLSQAMARLEEHFIAHAMTAAGGRVADAAQLLGLSRKGLFLKRRRRGLVEH